MAGSTIDPKAHKRASDREKAEALLDAAATQFVMSDARGRRYVAGLLKHCNPLKSAFDPNGSKENFNLGMQNMGLIIYAQLEATCPDLFLTLRREQNQREEQANV